MFKQNEVESYKSMNKKFYDYIDFLNDDFFERDNGKLNTHYLGKKLFARNVGDYNNNFQILIVNEDGTPLAYIDLLNKRIMVCNFNNYVKDEVANLNNEFFKNIKERYNKILNSRFIRKKKKEHFRENLSKVIEIESEANELIGEINDISKRVANIILFSLQEMFEKEFIEDIMVKHIYVRYNDIELSHIFFKSQEDLQSLCILIRDLLVYKFCTLKEEDYID